MSQTPVSQIPVSMDPRDRLIVALDVGSVDEAQAMVERIGDAATFYKIGYRLAFADGLPFARGLVASGRKVFLDLKLHDIGNTVADGVDSVLRLGASFLTVHAYPQTMRAAVKARGASALRLLAVTVLTSWDDADAAEAGYRGGVQELVRMKAAQAREAGIDGIVCSAAETAMVREVVGPDVAIVTPGIRPAWSETGDQKRIVTPADAARLGVDHMVVGRPILQAADPRDAARRIVEEFCEAR
jgi:orotidine-5'-phosphate decarboxylase